MSLRSSIVAAVRGAARGVFDLLLPPLCLTCDTPVDQAGRFCAPCFQATSFITAPCCDICGVPFARAREQGREPVCHACLTSPPRWRRARAAIRYDGQAKRLILPLKYADRIDLVRPLAAMMARAGAALLVEADVLVPVPLHRGRLLSRKYNQAALLARALGRLNDVPVLVDALRRMRATASLGALSAADRASAVDGAFVVRPERVAGIVDRRVLLIDDVLTSGATCGGCADALMEAGALSVDVLAAARVSVPWAQ